MGWIKRIVEGCSRLLMGMTIVCLVLMMVNIIADVLLRTLFDIPVPATAEFTAFYYMVGAVFLPLPLVEIRDESIKVDLFFNMAPETLKAIMISFAYIAQIAFFSLMFWQTGQDAIEAFEKSDFVDSQIKIYVWPGRFFLPLGFGLAALVSSVKLLERFSGKQRAASQGLIGH